MGKRSVSQQPNSGADVLISNAALYGSGQLQTPSGPNLTLGARSQMSAPEGLTDLRSAASK